MVEKNTKRIQKYYANQLKEDQMTLNECIDPFTGEPAGKGTKEKSLKAKPVKKPSKEAKGASRKK